MNSGDRPKIFRRGTHMSNQWLGVSSILTGMNPKWLREAWILNEFAQVVAPLRIRMHRYDPPDAYMATDSCEVPLEITEVIEPGRKRGLEYRTGMTEVQDDPVEDWIQRAEAIPSSLKLRIDEKEQRKYPPTTELLVYLNISEWGIRQREVEAQIGAILARPTGSFSKVHVLWKERVFSSDGQVRVHPKFAPGQDFRDDD